MKEKKLHKIFSRVMAIALSVIMVATSVDLSTISAEAATKVKKVSVSKTAVSIAVGGTATIKATVSPGNATKKTLKYKSSNTKVATVSTKGKITGKKAGTATITVSTTDGSKKTAKVKVTVKNVKMKSMSIKAAKTTITVGKTTTIKVTKVSPSNTTNKKVKWTSSNTKIATVSSTGKITAKKPGTVTIKATATDGSKKTKSVKIKVVPIYVKTLSVKATKTTLVVGNTTTVKVSKITPSNATIKTVKWTSSNTAVATVSSTGKVTAKKAGTVTITATSTDGKKIKGSVKITVKSKVSSVTVTVPKEEIIIGNNMAATVKVTPSTAVQTVKWSSSDKTIAGVNQKGIITARRSGTVTITATSSDGTKKGSVTITVIQEVAEDGTIELGGTRVSVHDPSIVKEGDTYYIFGSHMAWAKSEDLVNWTTFTNNINTQYATLFADEFAWAKKAGGAYDPSGNLWAPDVIWNASLGKWCMYMSINGMDWNSTISLLTADHLDGNWTYVGPVIQSGMSCNRYGVTFDYTEVTGETTVNSRYTSTFRNNIPRWEPHAIDPCVFYDEDGNLWMSYGSWSGGIGLFRLNNSNGLRSYTTKYNYVADVSDPYFGYKIAGGSGVSGEASYIEHIGDYYYLFMSYGGLVANGGYSMRIFRSENVTGPYVDLSGDDARRSHSTNAGNINGNVGIKLMTYYRWSHMQYGQVAQGHNSAFVDSDGRAYVVYHTRFNDGTEGHSVRVHQLFVNQDGWLVAAPYEYRGEALSETGYFGEVSALSSSGVDLSSMAGTYEILLHKQSIDYTNLECVEGEVINLQADGKVTGAYTGTWTAQTDSPYVTIKLGTVTYKGVFIEQYVEGIDAKTLCFTALGSNEVELWGSRNISGKEAVRYSIEEGIVKVPSQTIGDIEFTTEGAFGTTVSYVSSNPDIITNDGKVTIPSQTTVVTITATFTSDNYSETKDYEITVFGQDESGKILIGEYYTDEPFDLSGQTSVPNPFNKNVTAGINPYSGMTIEFDVTENGTSDRLSPILAFMGNDGGSGRMYFTGGSYLGYNAIGGYFDANLAAGYGAGMDYINETTTIRIDYKVSGFEVYANGEFAYSNTNIGSGLYAGDLTNFMNVLTWLNESADSLKFGTGVWEVWTAKYNGTISNVKVYAYPIADDSDPEAVYHQTFTTSDISAWSGTDTGSIKIANDGTDRGNYLRFETNSGVSGNRSAYCVVDAATSGNYTLTVDTKLTAGVNSQRSNSGFALLTTAAANYTNHDLAASGYLFKLFNAAPGTQAANVADYSIQDQWTIVDADTTNTDQVITIPVDTWVTVTAVVDVTSKTATVSIVDCATGDVYLEATELAISGDSTTFMGVQLQRGRGVGTASVDEIKVMAN